MYKLQQNRIIFEDEGLFEHLPLLGLGSDGEVRKFRIGNEIYALKLFNGVNNVNLNEYEKKLNINIESFISPKKLLFVNDIFRGYIMDFCKGKDLEFNSDLNITLQEFYIKRKKLLEDTSKLSELKFEIIDAYVSNAMYDKGFKIIDLDCFIYHDDLSVDEIKDINIETINDLLFQTVDK